MAEQSRSRNGALAAHVGRQLRHRRRALGYSQQYLAEQAGISFQQLQKYEQGKNELNAHRLLAFAGLLRVNVPYFFAGLEGESGAAPPPPTDIPDSRESQNLAQYFARIGDGDLRRQLIRLAERLAMPSEDGSAHSGTK